jgi:hypothetical protein
LPATGCAHVALTVKSQGGGATIVATAADGRRAERTISQPSSLAPTALGLVASIPGDAPVDAWPAPVAAGAARAITAPVSRSALVSSEVVPSWPSPFPPPPPAGDAPAARPGSRGDLEPLALWLGFGVGGRAGRPTQLAMADLEARLDAILVGRWIVFAAVRYTPVGATTLFDVDNDQYHEWSGSLGAGRRLTLGPTKIDLGLAPELVAMKMEGDFSGDVVERRVQPRLDAWARWVVPFAAEWQVALTGDADVAPLDVAQAPDPNPRLPALPTWTLGLRLGVTGALL